MDIVPPKSIPITDSSSDDVSSEMQPTEAPAEHALSEETQLIAAAPEETVQAEASSVPAVDTIPSDEVVTESASPDDTDSPVTEPPVDQSSEVGADQSLSTENNPMAINKPVEPIKHKAPKMAVIVAVVIGLMLIGVVIFAYSRSHKSASSSTKSSSQNTAKATSPASVDQASKDLDTTLSKADDSKDFAANDLADTILALNLT